MRWEECKSSSGFLAASPDTREIGPQGIFAWEGPRNEGGELKHFEYHSPDSMKHTSCGGALRKLGREIEVSPGCRQVQVCSWASSGGGSRPREEILLLNPTHTQTHTPVGNQSPFQLHEPSLQPKHQISKLMIHVQDLQS